MAKIIENYTLLRFPDRKVRFINAGVGGDTAAGGLRRLDRDVFAHKPTVLLVAYGVNDIGWGTKADDQHKKLYLQGVRGIVEACNEHKVRVYICSAAITAEDPAKAEKGFLQTMCDEGMELSRSLGGHSIDVDRLDADYSAKGVGREREGRRQEQARHTAHGRWRASQRSRPTGNGLCHPERARCSGRRFIGRHRLRGRANSSRPRASR